jgi:hypothetical protein
VKNIYKITKKDIIYANKYYLENIYILLVMFNVPMQKTSPFDTYNTVQTQYQNIKNLNCFNTFTAIPTNDLMTISNINIDSVDKLSEISVFYIKKLSEPLNNNLIIQLEEMIKYHNMLLEKIYEFNKISQNILKGVQDIFTLKLSQDVANYIYFDNINRYKLIIVQIINLIKQLNVFVGLIKI